MASKSLNVPSMLRAAFLKAELDFLQSQPEFVEALETVHTAQDFERLCELAEQILKASSRNNASAQQLRDGNRKRPPHG